MSIIGTLRSLAQLGFDVGEAIFYSVFDFDRVADEMWADAKADRFAEKEAEDEVGDPPCAICGRHKPIVPERIYGGWSGICGDCMDRMTDPYDCQHVSQPSSPATASAGGVHPSCSVPDPRDVEQEGLQPLSVSEFADIVIELHDIATHMAWLGTRIPQDRLEVIADRLAAAGLAMK